MGRKRDAKTGVYLSDEEAKGLDPSMWVEETDSDNVRELLQKIYDRCLLNAITPSGVILDGTSVVPVSQLERIFNEYGAKIK